MKVLAISPAIPARNAKGYQVQAYYRLLHLSENHCVSVVCFGQGKIDEKHKSALLRLGINVVMLPWQPAHALYSAFKALLNPEMPLQCALFSSSAFEAKVHEVAREIDPDFILATTIRVLPNLVGRFDPLVLDLVDSMALNFRRRAERAPWWSRMLWSLEKERVASYERAAAERALTSFVVSAVDRQEIDCVRTNVLPLGIDVDYFNLSSPSTNPNIVFTGNMSYKPNVEAAIWFASECWSFILAANPRAKFLIAGNRPIAAVRELEKIKNVQVLGHVDDMASVIKSAQVAIAPMQSGSGMQFKILEAMACGVPVVTSSLGLGDIRATHHSELVIANTPAEFIDSVLELLSSLELRSQIGIAGHDFIIANNTWNAVNSCFESKVFEDLYDRNVNINRCN